MITVIIFYSNNVLHPLQFQIYNALRFFSSFTDYSIFIPFVDWYAKYNPNYCLMIWANDQILNTYATTIGIFKEYVCQSVTEEILNDKVSRNFLKLYLDRI